MPPSVFHCLAAIDEDDLGSTELWNIEVVEDGAIIVEPSPLRGSTPRCNTKVVLGDDCSVLDVDDDESEGYEIFPEMNSLLDTLIYSCVGCMACEPCTGTLLKPRGGILKKGGVKTNSGDVQTKEHPLNERTVSFSSLEIREFNMTLGEHPCASSGPPVMLDWESKPTNERHVTLDEYEKMRLPRRSRSKLKLSYKDRKGILEGQRGFSPEEVNQAWAEAIKIRRQRDETLKRGLFLMTLDEAWESAQRKGQRVVECVGMV